MNRQNEYAERLKKAMLFLRGNECIFCCSTSNLEFAHKKPGQNGIGEGRGKIARYLKIRNRPTDFILLCHNCHQKYDIMRMGK